MLREPVQHQLAILGLKAAANALERLNFSDEQIEGLGLLLEAEILERMSKSQSQRIKLAKLSQSAHPADVDLRTPRNLSKVIWQRLLSLNWLKQHHHLLLIGPTGIGKSYLACAIAKAAIEQKHSVRYLRMPRLQDELALVRAQGKLSLCLNSSKIDNHAAASSSPVNCQSNSGTVNSPTQHSPTRSLIDWYTTPKKSN